MPAKKRAGKPKAAPRGRKTPGNRADKLARFRKILIELRSQMADQIRMLSASSLMSNKQAGEELADVGSDDFMRDTELALMGEEEQRLDAIERALRRIDEGTYGICQDCGDAIAPGRLEAKPYANLCVSCMSARETQAGLHRR
jgi:DnaK suppressor protein